MIPFSIWEKVQTSSLLFSLKENNPEKKCMCRHKKKLNQLLHFSFTSRSFCAAQLSALQDRKRSHFLLTSLFRNFAAEEERRENWFSFLWATKKYARVKEKISPLDCTILLFSKSKYRFTNAGASEEINEKLRDLPDPSELFVHKEPQMIATFPFSHTHMCTDLLSSKPQKSVNSVHFGKNFHPFDSMLLRKWCGIWQLNYTTVKHLVSRQQLQLHALLTKLIIQCLVTFHCRACGQSSEAKKIWK